MRENPENRDNVLDVLKERAKELNCLYRVEGVLENRALTLPGIFNAIISIIPSGCRFPEECRARIVYDNNSFHPPDFKETPWIAKADIKLDGRAVGKIEVCYLREVPRSDEGVFLEKERKLIRTVAERIGQTALNRDMERMLKEWESAGKELSRTEDSRSEWKIIVDLLKRTDQGLLLYICRKMINHLFWIGVEEAAGILRKMETDPLEPRESGEVNFPSLRQPMENVIKISEKTFKAASEHLSDNEITLRVKKWIHEEKYNFLVKAVDRIDSSLADIIDAISRYKSISETQGIPYTPTDRWLKAALIYRFLSEDLAFINTARRYIEVQDFYSMTERMIYPARSRGRLGGKSTGLFLARQVLEKTSGNIPELKGVRVPKTWYITSDEVTEFLHYNNLQELKEQKYKELYEIRIDYPNIVQLLKNSRFPPEIVKSLSAALDDFGDSPLIVRSSSLLEDRIGAAFSGKYRSLFIANQGSKKERLDSLMNAVAEVYASKFNPDAIQYRRERGLLDYPEEMGVMIQEVVGRRIGHYYLPLYAGVAFSSNEFLWSPRIKREDGLIRLVPGLGTRAVDRVSDDFPVLISPGQPGLRTNTAPDEIRHYSPKHLDVINLRDNSFDTLEISSFLKKFGDDIPEISDIVSVYRDNHISTPSKLGMDFEKDEPVVTFNGLISKRPLVSLVKKVIDTLQEKLEFPVDIEFASDGKDFYLLQCRAQSYTAEIAPPVIPPDIPETDMLFSAGRHISNGRADNISHIVYVDPEEYYNLTGLDDLVAVGRIVGKLNSLLPKRQFLLMGPGRWGSRGDIRLGVPVTYSDISNTSMLIEISGKKGEYQPDLSFGTHFFQDLVEAGIRYLPLYPEEEGEVLRESFFREQENLLEKLLPEHRFLGRVVKVIDVAGVSGGRVLRVLMNAELSRAVGYLAAPSPEKSAPAAGGEEYSEPKGEDEFWRWRYHMAGKIASRLDPGRFGVAGVYVFGSTNSAAAGPGSDIDLLVHFRGTGKQRMELERWFEGWSQCLAEMNYLKTGYVSEGLLDLHFITDEDIKNKSSYAVKIGAVTDPAHRLDLKNEAGEK